jgi:hypothetical protein
MGWSPVDRNLAAAPGSTGDRLGTVGAQPPARFRPAHTSRVPGHWSLARPPSRRFSVAAGCSADRASGALRPCGLRPGSFEGLGGSLGTDPFMPLRTRARRPSRKGCPGCQTISANARSTTAHWAGVPGMTFRDPLSRRVSSGAEASKRPCRAPAGSARGRERDESRRPSRRGAGSGGAMTMKGGKRANAAVRPSTNDADRLHSPVDGGAGQR